MARAQALADDLLVAEEDCFARIEGALVLAAPKAERAVVVAWRRAKQDIAALPGDGQLFADLFGLHRAAIESARPAVADLADTAVAASLKAIEEELGWCEESLAVRYAGTAALGVHHAATVADGLREAALHTHLLGEVAALLYFGDAVRDALLMAAQSQDAQATVHGRLFSREPFRARGAGGRGVWFRTGSDLNASARGVCISLMNLTRQAAMTGMNEAAGAR